MCISLKKENIHFNKNFNVLNVNNFHCNIYMNYILFQYAMYFFNHIFDNDFHFYNINKNNKKHYSNIFKENMNL